MLRRRRRATSRRSSHSLSARPRRARSFEMPNEWRTGRGHTHTHATENVERSSFYDWRAARARAHGTGMAETQCPIYNWHSANVAEIVLKPKTQFAA